MRLSSPYLYSRSETLREDTMATDITFIRGL